MIKLFGKDDTQFDEQYFGDIVLHPIKCSVHNADNGDFYLDCETDLQYVDELESGRIVVVPTPQGEQPFRIGDITRTRKRVTFRAWHVYYDTEGLAVTEVFKPIPIRRTCQDYLDALASHVKPSNPFTMTSDITTPIPSGYNRLVHPGSMFSAVNEIIEFFNAHLVRDGFSFELNGSIGADRGITIRYGGNMQDITVDESWNEVCTRCYPIGKDGITIDSPGYVESSVQYDIAYCKSVTFSQDIDREDYPSDTAYQNALKADLLAQATAYVNNACYPQVNYQLHAHLDDPVDIGDTIQVIDERLGINLFTSVISYDYDAVFQRFTNIEFGNFRKTLSGFASAITTAASSTAIAQVTTDIASQIAAAKLEMFPVGSIYISVNSTDPASFIGGTWERIQDTFLLAAGSTYSAGATGGEATHTLTASEMPKHKHEGLYWQSIAAANQIGLNNDNTTGYQLTWTGNRGPNTNHKLITAEAGSGSAHNNMPPYLAVFVWKRTA